MENYKTIIITVVSVIAVLLLGVFIVQGPKNKAIFLEETVEQSKSDIDTQIDRKINVLTELAEVVKHYDEHEYKTIVDAIAARNNNDGGDVNTKEVITEIKAVAEAYPELKSQDNYARLMDNVSECENLLSQHKKAYNSSVKKYRQYVRSFPARMFLNMTGYDVIKYDLYQTTNADNTLKLF